MTRYLWFPVVLVTMAIGVLLLKPRVPPAFQPEQLVEGWGGALVRTDAAPDSKAPAARAVQSLRDGNQNWSLAWSAGTDTAPATGDTESADLLLFAVQYRRVEPASRHYEVELNERRVSGGFEAIALAGQTPVDEWAMNRVNGGERVAFLMRDRNLLLIGQMRIGPGRAIPSETDAAARLRDLAQRVRSAARP